MSSDVGYYRTQTSLSFSGPFEKCFYTCGVHMSDGLHRRPTLTPTHQPHPRSLMPKPTQTLNPRPSCPRTTTHTHHAKCQGQDPNAKSKTKHQTHTDHKVAFLCYFLLGDLEACLALLSATNRTPEAAFLARTYHQRPAPQRHFSCLRTPQWASHIGSFL